VSPLSVIRDIGTDVGDTFRVNTTELKKWKVLKVQIRQGIKMICTTRLIIRYTIFKSKMSQSWRQKAYTHRKCIKHDKVVTICQACHTCRPFGELFSNGGSSQHSEKINQSINQSSISVQNQTDLSPQFLPYLTLPTEVNVLPLSALRQLMGPIRIPKLTTRLQNPQV